jgi:hypothetical protein
MSWETVAWVIFRGEPHSLGWTCFFFGGGYRAAAYRCSCNCTDVHKLIAAAVQLQQRYATAPAEPCYELHTGRGGAKMPTRHPMMHFCRFFGVLAPPERQECQHQGGQCAGAHGFVPRQPRDRASRPDKFPRGESKNNGFRTKFRQVFLGEIFYLVHIRRADVAPRGEPAVDSVGALASRMLLAHATIEYEAPASSPDGHVQNSPVWKRASAGYSHRARGRRCPS